MISKPILKRLINRYLSDAQVLLANRRYATAVYIGGYAIELALKYKICRLMKFGKGFPENETEFNKYFKNVRKAYLRLNIRHLKDIRHHDIQRLLDHTGEKLFIENNYSKDWSTLKTWQPATRYLFLIIQRNAAAGFVSSAQAIVQHLIK